MPTSHEGIEELLHGFAGSTVSSFSSRELDEVVVDGCFVINRQIELITVMECVSEQPDGLQTVVDIVAIVVEQSSEIAP